MSSIRFRFSGVFLLVLAAVFILGCFSVWRLADYRTFSDELRDRFFRSTQYIGDLNNFTSDFRAGEATALLAADPTQTASNAKDLSQLDHLIVLAQHSFEHVDHGKDEFDLYGKFRSQWTVYRAVANQVFALIRAGKLNDAATLYKTRSKSAYDAASDTLGALTALNVTNAIAAAKQADLAYQEARFLTLAAMAFAGLMVFGGLIYMRRSIAEPLVRLARTMHGLARNDMDIAIHGGDRKDEIGDMALAVEVFRKNAIDLAVSQKALADQASMLTEKLEAEQRLTQLQRNFLSMASHEFRTPLTVIDGQAQRLITTKDRLSADAITERAGKIRGAVMRITSVIDNLIDMTRLADPGAELYFHPTELDLSLLLREVCQFHREIVPTVYIREKFSLDPLLVRGDRVLLFQLFSNLISNGIKYSTDDRWLTVSVHPEGDQILIQVDDEGIGIAEADRERLFERYFRGSNVSGTVGTGVGLYLVKTITDLHGGDILVESEEGEGSRFTVGLPIDPPSRSK